MTKVKMANTGLTKWVKLLLALVVLAVCQHSVVLLCQ